MNSIPEDGRNLDREVPGVSFEGFVEEWYETVDATAQGLVKDKDLAKEAAHATWKQVATAWRRGNRPRHPAAWLMTTLRREVARQAHRPLPPALLSDPPAPAAADPVERREERELVRRVLAEISPPDREILILRFIEGLSPREIQRRLRLPRSTFYERIERARDRFVRIFRLRE